MEKQGAGARLQRSQVWPGPEEVSVLYPLDLEIQGRAHSSDQNLMGWCWKGKS